jgi:hypothetical protein
VNEVTNHIMVQVRDLVAEIRDEPAPAEFYRPGSAAADDKRAS